MGLGHNFDWKPSVLKREVRVVSGVLVLRVRFQVGCIFLVASFQLTLRISFKLTRRYLGDPGPFYWALFTYSRFERTH